MIERNFDIYIFHAQTYSIDLYKPLTARCESAQGFEKCEKMETAEKIYWKTKPGDKRLSTFAKTTQYQQEKKEKREGSAESHRKPTAPS